MVSLIPCTHLIQKIHETMTLAAAGAIQVGEARSGLVNPTVYARVGTVVIWTDISGSSGGFFVVVGVHVLAQESNFFVPTLTQLPYLLIEEQLYEG